MVLVHGGGGTAFAEWVKAWTSRGYAAIAMDTCGQIPKGIVRQVGTPRILAAAGLGRADRG